MKRNFLLFSLLLAAGCVQHKGVYVDLIDSHGSDKLFSDVFRSVEFIPLESGTTDSITFVNDILYYKGLYLIRDIPRNTIFCFDSAGKFKFRIGSGGLPPYDLGRFADFTINKKEGTVEVFDFSGKIIGFDLSGAPRYARKFNYSLTEFACTGNGNYVIYSPNQVNSDGKDTIAPGAFLVDSAGKFKKSILKIVAPESYIQPINCLSGYGDSIVLVSNYSHDVYLVNDENVTKIFRIGFDESKFDWSQGLIASYASGDQMNINYRRDPSSGEGSSVYLSIDSQKQLFFGKTVNDFFGLPSIIPYFYQDAQTMVGFLLPADLQLLKEDRFKNVQADPALISQLFGLSGRLRKGDNPVMVKFHLMIR
jgi:6-bladed beta-propeller